MRSRRPCDAAQVDADGRMGRGRTTLLVACWTILTVLQIGADGPGVPKLGILAAVQLDGSVSLYSVPHPRAVGRADASSGVAQKPIYRE